MTKIFIASANLGKIKEFKSIVDEFQTHMSLDLVCVSLNGFFIPEPDEPFDTFHENACHKARFYGEKTGMLALADDSGLCIEALDGFPGVKTKDFWVSCGGIDEAILKLQDLLENTSNKSAYYEASIALYCPRTKNTYYQNNREYGTLTFSAQKGVFGFGFDSIFIPKGYQDTFSILGPDVKNAVSHRARATKQLLHDVFSKKC